MVFLSIINLQFELDHIMNCQKMGCTAQQVLHILIIILAISCNRMTLNHYLGFYTTMGWPAPKHKVKQARFGNQGDTTASNLSMLNLVAFYYDKHKHILEGKSSSKSAYIS